MTLRMVSALAALMLTLSASADVRRLNASIRSTLAEEIYQELQPRADDAIYRTGNGALTLGDAGYDDYDTATPGDVAFISGLRFCGGVHESDDVVRFTWGAYFPPDTSAASPILVPMVTTSLPLGLYATGTFQWTFSFEAPASIPDHGVLGGQAYFQIDSPSNSVTFCDILGYSQWLGVGGNDPNVGSSGIGNAKAFSFLGVIPDPATLTLLIAGAACLRRGRHPRDA